MRIKVRNTNLIDSIKYQEWKVPEFQKYNPRADQRRRLLDGTKTGLQTFFVTDDGYDLISISLHTREAINAVIDY